MISFKYKFIYIHIPKTGGNSIQAALASYSSDILTFRKSVGNVIGEDGLQGLDVTNSELDFSEPRHKHATISDYYEKLGDRIYDFYLFTSVRNPWDRFISQNAFLNSIEPKILTNLDQLSYPTPMVDYLTLNGEIVVKNFIRFESISDDFNWICRQIKIEPSPLPHKNRSNRENYQIYYDEKSKTFVEKMYEEDINQYKYKFGGN